MDKSDFYDLVESVGRDEDAYVSIDRLRIAKEFLVVLCEDSNEIQEMSVADLIALMEDVL